MEIKQTKLVIGFITYGQVTSPYLPYFLPSLEHECEACKILVIDNTEQKANVNAEYIKANYPKIDFSWAGSNLGFAQAYNLLINKASAMGADYFLMINPDMMLEVGCLKKLVKAMDDNNFLGSVSPKVLRWDFVNKKKTEIIDTCGIKMKSGLRFIDLGQGQIDKNQFNSHQIIGPSGCAGLYRLSALNEVKIEGKYLDEMFFMYKEDVDLAYRLYLAGWKSELVPEAIAYHDRTIISQGESNWHIIINRKNKSRQNKRWSFWGQQVLFYKFWSWQNLWQKLNIIWYQFKILIYIILFERYLFAEIIKFEKIKKQIKARVKLIKVKFK